MRRRILHDSLIPLAHSCSIALARLGPEAIEEGLGQEEVEYWRRQSHSRYGDDACGQGSTEMCVPYLNQNGMGINIDCDIVLKLHACNFQIASKHRLWLLKLRNP